MKHLKNMTLGELNETMLEYKDQLILVDGDSVEADSIREQIELAKEIINERIFNFLTQLEEMPELKDEEFKAIDDAIGNLRGRLNEY